jgi:hypothetical protein
MTMPQQSASTTREIMTFWERRGCGAGVLRRLAAPLVGLAMLMPGTSALPATGSVTRIEEPVLQRRLSNGDIRFSVSAHVGGGTPIEAMLDTGSFGLRVMARALAPTQYEATGITRGYGYGSGVVLRGPLATAVVAIGDATTDAPISIQVVQSVGCSQANPDCPATRLAPGDYGIGGDGLRHEGFDAIPGLSMRGSDAPGAAVNPLSVMGSRRWIVILPGPGAAAPGRLILNPGAGDLAGFRPVRPRSLPARADGRPQVVDSEIPNCPDKPLEQQSSCPPMMLDSGAGPGVRPFYSCAILFDAENGTIAVKAR